MGKSQKLYERAKKLIPGGTQLLSKRPEMFLPGRWPAYYSSAKGCEITDLDGKTYIDASLMGVGACVLGYADPDVNAAAAKAVAAGSMSTLNCPEEVALAETLCKIHPWADMVRYSRCGGESMAVAVRIARAYTGKDLVLFCGYHGWHDWYISSNIADNKSLDGHLLPGLAPKGVPRALKNTALPFRYNDLKSFFKLTREHKNKIAAVVMEPIRNISPAADFLGAIRDYTRKNGIVLLIDEVSAGWRIAPGGAHIALGVEPDMAVFAKAMSNGFPMGAIIGRREVMSAAQDSFISSTYWTEKIGPAAALAMISKYEKLSVHKHLAKCGKKIQRAWAALAAANGLDVEVHGIYPLSHFSFRHPDALALKTLFTQYMLDKGFLASTAFYFSYAHKDKHLDKYASAADEVFFKIAKALRAGDYMKKLKGPVCHSGFKRLT